MALTPLVVLAHKRWAPRAKPSMDGVDVAQGLTPQVLIIGFGRVGQIASQGVLAKGAGISIIDTDTQVIRDAQAYGFKVYFGDGCRADVLRAAGAHQACAIMVCIDDKAAATRIAELAKAEFPNARVLVRAFDREHALELLKADVDFQIRETFESAMLMSHAAVLALGASTEEADDILRDVRRRDSERLDLELAGGRFAGRALILSNVVTPSSHSPAPSVSDGASTSAKPAENPPT
jgi:glutathione-regulated potassium-efflux system protein KefB